VHEIKHDGFRMLVRRDAAGVRLLTRNGHDWTQRYGNHEDRSPTHGYESTREAAMHAFARSWHRET